MVYSLVATATAPTLEATELEDLLTYLQRSHQINLTVYKRSTLLRRTVVRMQEVGVANYQDYRVHLQQQPNEAAQLLSTIFINFTYFFRDRLVWDYLAYQVIPQILARKQLNEPIRVWSAGCASGQETYSLAMLLAEALGVNQFQQRVQLYGTDVDRDAVLQARSGSYSPIAVEGIPPDLLERYLDRTISGYCWRSDLQHSIRFAHHNLTQHLPLPHIDLLVCRNVLMYLTLEAQTQVLTTFHRSLSKTGLLLVGQVENLVSHSQASLFTPIARPVKLFATTPKPAIAPLRVVSGSKGAIERAS